MDFSMSFPTMDIQESQSLAQITYILAAAPFKHPTIPLFEINKILSGCAFSGEFIMCLNPRIVKIIDKFICDGLLHHDDQKCLSSTLQLINKLYFSIRKGIKIPIYGNVMILENLYQILISRLIPQLQGDGVRDLSLVQNLFDFISTEQLTTYYLLDEERKIIFSLILILHACSLEREIASFIYHLLAGYKGMPSIVYLIGLSTQSFFSRLIDDEQISKFVNEQEREIIASFLAKSIQIIRTGIMPLGENSIGLMRYTQRLKTKLCEIELSYIRLDCEQSAMKSGCIHPSQIELSMSNTVLKSPRKKELKFEPSTVKKNPPEWMDIFQSTASKRNSPDDEESSVSYTQCSRENTYPFSTCKFPYLLDKEGKRSGIRDVESLENTPINRDSLRTVPRALFKIRSNKDSSDRTNLEVPEEKRKRRWYAILRSKKSKSDICWKCIFWPWHYYNHDLNIE